MTKELIDHLGTKIIRTKFPGVKGAQYVGPSHTKLEHLFVPTSVNVGEGVYTAHVPGNYGTDTVRELADTLTELRLDEDPALQAYLALPDVNAISGNIMEDFHSNYIGPYRSIEDAIYALSGVTDRIGEVHEYAEERRLTIDGISPDYDTLGEDVASGFDIVDRESRAYAFYK